MFLLGLLKVEGNDFGPTCPPAATLTSQRNKFKNRVPNPFPSPSSPSVV
jgi:hypothetical protein